MDEAALETRGLTRALAWGSFSVVAGVIAFGIVASFVYGGSIDAVPDLESSVAPFFLALLPFALAGVFLALRRPSNPIGWLLMAVAFCWTALAGAANYGLAGLFTDFAPLPGAAPAMALVGGLWFPGFVCMGLVVFLFPNGRPVSPRWRWVIWLAGITALAVVVASAVNPAPLNTDLGGVNPFAWEAAQGTIDAILGIASFLGFVLAPITLASIVVRYRRSEDIVRQQVKWLLFAVSVALGAAVVVSLRDALDFRSLDPLVDAIGFVGLAAVGFVPVAIAIAITRHGLYDLGRIVNRTVVYTVAIGALAAIYALGVLVIGSFLPVERNSLVVAMTTLLVASLFNPLRKRVQRRVNSWFYRSSYDPEQVIERLRSRLSDSLDPNTVLSVWVDITASTFQPAELGVWIRERSQSGRRG